MRLPGVLLQAAGRRFLGGALETLFGSGPADDLLTLAEAKPRLLVPQRLPKLHELCVEILDLGRDRRVKPLGKALPELLALLRELVDLGVNLRCGHVV